MQRKPSGGVGFLNSNYTNNIHSFETIRKQRNPSAGVGFLNSNYTNNIAYVCFAFFLRVAWRASVIRYIVYTPCLGLANQSGCCRLSNPVFDFSCTLCLRALFSMSEIPQPRYIKCVSGPLTPSRRSAFDLPCSVCVLLSRHL